MNFEQSLDSELREALAAFPASARVTNDVVNARLAVSEMLAAFQGPPSVGTGKSFSSWSRGLLCSTYLDGCFRYRTVD